MGYKFKVGDKVRVVHPRKSHKNKFIGNIYTIRKLAPNGFSWSTEPNYGVEEKCGYIWWEDEIELVPNEKIVITTDGKTTKATLYRDGVKTIATANCSPEDTFDFNVGAKLAMERLMKATEPPKYYNGKVVCVKNTPGNDGAYIVGKIYEFVDGTFTDETGWSVGDCGGEFTSFEQWQNFSSSEWLEIKE